MLRNLSVRGFKSLRNVEVELDQLVVVFGPNAAGKSNLLEALVLLSRLVVERTLADAFDRGIRGYPVEAFTLAGEDDAPAGPDAPPQTLRLGARMELAKRQLDYQVEVAVRAQTGQLTLVDERLARLTSKGKLDGNPAVERIDTDPEFRFYIRRKAKASHPFEEKGPIGHTLVSNLQYSGNDRFPDFDALRREVSDWRVVYLDPREAMRRAQPPREVDDIGERGEFLVLFLHRLAHDEKHKKDFDAIVRAARAVIPSIEAVRTELAAARGEIDLSVKQDGTWMSSRVLSEGTLRALALCAMAANHLRTGLVAFEEPENGVHPRRIEVITRLLASASRHGQVVVTTQSPLIVSEIVRLVRTGELAADRVRLLQCTGGPGGTEVQALNPMDGLFTEGKLRGVPVADSGGPLALGATGREANGCWSTPP